VAGALIDPDKSLDQKLAALPRIIAFYAVWYVSLWFGWVRWPRYRSFGPLARHLRFVERSSRKLARSVFYGMLLYRGALERRQAFLFRAVDIGLDLFAMVSSISRAQGMLASGDGSSAEASRIAELVCRNGQRTVQASFRGLWRNDDAFRYDAGREVLDGRAAWLENGAVGLRATVDDLRPQTESHRVGEGSTSVRRLRTESRDRPAREHRMQER
jgi:hypothetical protein